MSKDKKNIDYDKLNIECNPTNNVEQSEKDGKRTETATDVYYKTQCKLPESDVAVPTYDSVLEAKEWVDDQNKK